MKNEYINLVKSILEGDEQIPDGVVDGSDPAFGEAEAEPEAEVAASNEFELSYSDSDSYYEMEKELRKGYIDRIPENMLQRHEEIGRKLREIEGLGLLTKFQDMGFESYEKAHKAWRADGYKESTIFPYLKGGVKVANGEMVEDPNMK